MIEIHDVDKREHHPTVASLGWAARRAYSADDGRQAQHLFSHYAARSLAVAALRLFPVLRSLENKLPGVGRSRDVGVDMPDVYFQPRTFAELTSE